MCSVKVVIFNIYEFDADAGVAAADDGNGVDDKARVHEIYTFAVSTFSSFKYAYAHI